MNYKLSCKHCKDGKRRHLILYFLNGVQILKQKIPFDENFENGFNFRTSIFDVYLLNNNLYQTRIKNNKKRNIKFPVSKKKLEIFNIPENLKISE